MHEPIRYLDATPAPASAYADPETRARRDRATRAAMLRIAEAVARSASATPANRAAASAHAAHLRVLIAETTR